MSWEADTGGMVKESEWLEQREGGESGGGEAGERERSCGALLTIERSQHPAYTMTTASCVTPILGKASYACLQSSSNLS